jgi:teichuronic acid biosynthesis glycosyltransferase TuaC
MWCHTSNWFRTSKRRPLSEAGPHIVVLSSLFPSSVQPGAGLFVRERMFRVGGRLPLSVVAPTAWFPGQAWMSRWRPGFRPGAPRQEQQAGFNVVFPRFFSVPGVFKWMDGAFMARAAWPLLKSLKAAGQLDVLDAHFAYPDGFAAVRLAQKLGVPVTITMRGTEMRHAKDLKLRPRLAWALQQATRVFTVSDSLRQLALELGVPAERVKVIGNGVDLSKFRPIPQAQARLSLNLPVGAKVLVSVGGLCERKGFHRVIEAMPQLCAAGQDVHLLVAGGPSPEGDWTQRLHAQVQQLGLTDRVHFLGPVTASDLHKVLSAADVFVLATSNEGWANVFLEAMACGLPVVTTRVGGNAEVVCRPDLGIVVPFGDTNALCNAMAQALRQHWDRAAILAYAQANTWDQRVDVLEAEFRALAQPSGAC